MPNISDMLRHSEVCEEPLPSELSAAFDEALLSPSPQALKAKAEPVSIKAASNEVIILLRN